MQDNFKIKVIIYEQLALRVDSYKAFTILVNNGNLIQHGNVSKEVKVVKYHSPKFNPNAAK